MKLVLIEWEDSNFSLDGWQPKQDLMSFNTQPSVAAGIVLSDDGVRILLVPVLSSFAAGQAVAIPKSCIKKMWKLKTSKRLI